MNYKPSDVMAVVQAVKKLGWNFTYANETFDGDRRNLNVNFYKLEEDPEAWREDNRKKQAAGVRFEKLWYDGFWRKGECDFTGKKEDYREVPQEVQKEGDMRIPEASEIRKWADRYYSLWCFVENSLPRDASSDTFDIFRGYARQVNDEIYGVTDKAKEPHAAERALWKAQREAGTNEVWQARNIYDHGPSNWADLSVHTEPQWASKAEYRVKPMKLTAKICRVGKAYPISYIGQDWEFTGTREEYRAECEKYGYAILSEIKEVVEKPKTVKYYFALYKTPHGYITSISGHTKDWVNEWITDNGHTIIGDIEEREV